MKKRTLPRFKAFLFFLFTTFFINTSFSQGRVVINEYMSWTLNGCGATAEFVELLNFGPGPMDIGGYVLTDGDFSVTIPANTILQPGAFYTISGQTILPNPCGNIDSTVTAQLNWNTCGCTSSTIPGTGDGFFTDGGNGNEPIVLFDRNLKIIDAVVRSLPTESSTLITTKDVGFGTHTFDLDLLSINYEVLGMSTGRGNSFARRIDGDCGWVKDPQQSAHATNNRSGEESSVTYTLTITNTMDCNGNGGSIVIDVDASNYSNLFPMNYILALDSNHNGMFDVNDQYTEGIDDSPRTIPISGLIAGRYRITVSSALGCNLESFDFTILPCMPVLPVHLELLKWVKTVNDYHLLEFRLSGTEHVKKVTLEKSADKSFFTEAAATSSQIRNKELLTGRMETPAQAGYSFYRLRIIKTDGTVFFSPVINIHTAPVYLRNSLWPNPAKDVLHVALAVPADDALQYRVYNTYGGVVSQGTIPSFARNEFITIPVRFLPAGRYQIIFTGTKGEMQPITLPFVKQY